MARFVELEQESGETVWVNPEHVVAVTPGREEGCWLLTEMGQRIKVADSPAEVVAVLSEEQWRSNSIAYRGPVDGINAETLDLVRENLNR